METLTLADANQHSAWDGVEPLLDDALARLGAGDRDALLLRFVDDLTVPEVAAALGISLAAAQKRVGRALNRLRQNLQHSGAVLTVAAVAVALDTKLVQASPASMVENTLRTVATRAPSTGAASLHAHALHHSIIREIAATKLRWAAAVVCGTAVMGTGFGALYSAPARSAEQTASAAVLTAQGPSISGIATYPDGKPAAGVRIAAQNYSSMQLWFESTTDSRGRYTITHLQPGTYNVAMDDTSAALNGDWTANAYAGVVFKPTSTYANYNFTLTPGTIISGTVTSSGKPVSGTPVGVYGPAHPRTTPWVQAVSSAGDGSFRLRVPPGRQYVYLLAGNTNAGANVVVGAGGLSGIRLRMN